MNAEEIERLYATLSYPTTAKFKAALEKRGVKLKTEEVQAITSKFGQRQVLAPEQKYAGRIVSPDLHARWAADLISYVAQPAVSSEQTYRYVLIVQDIFSRKIWTDALQSKDETTPAFERILDRVCRETPTKQIRSKTNTFRIPEDMRKPKEVICGRI